jgi:hypothetical protein
MKLVLVAAAAVAGAGLAIAAGVTATDDYTVRDASGRIVESGDLGALAMRIGDCFDDPERSIVFDTEDDADNIADAPTADPDSNQVVAVQGVPCTSPHDGEVFAIYELPYEDLPSETKLADDAWFGCYQRFEDYVGTPYESSTLDIWTLTPTPEGWDAGDREVRCYVFDYQGARLDVPARDSGL